MSEYGRSRFDSFRSNTCMDLVDLSKAIDSKNYDQATLAKDMKLCCKGIDEILERALYEKNNSAADLPKCFQEQCKLLKVVITALSDALLEMPAINSRAVNMTSLISTHVGRLTLDAHDNKRDRYASTCNDEFSYLEMIWAAPRAPVPKAAEAAIRVLAENWDKLNMPHEQCDCYQCTRRRA